MPSSPSFVPLKLTGGTWQMAAVAGKGGTLTPARADAPVTIVFGGDGKAGGRDGCNFFGARYLVRGRAIHMGRFQSTLILCSQAVLAQSDAVYAALRSARSFDITGERLRLQGDAGATLIVFRPAG